jgi:C-terminal processing protease CtpA/Prc
MAPHEIDDHFYIRVAFGRFVNPVTRTDWEGTGVEPDVKVPTAGALAVAERLAAEDIRKENTPRAGAG